MENMQVMDISSEKFTWRIEAFSKMNREKLSSKSFKVGGCRWMIVLNPKGKDVEYLSLYMMVAHFLPWSRFAYFRLTLINQLDSNKSIAMETKRKFSAGNRGWGFQSFIPLSEFHDPSQGYLVKDTCVIEAHVSVSKVDFNIPDNFNKSNGEQSSLTEVETEEQGMILSDVTSSPTSTQSFKDDQLSEIEVQLSQPEEQGMEHSKQVQFVPSAPPMYPSLSNEFEEVFLIPLSDIIDFKSLEPEEESFIPLWEEVCSWHPSLVENQRRRSPRFILWAFIALGRVLHFLKTKKIRDMGGDDFIHLQVLWEELHSFGFDLTWLEPHVHSALDAKAYLERAEHVKNLRVNVATLEIEMRKFEAKLAVAELDLEVSRRDLTEIANGFEERDMDAELGYGIP
ncbi:MATH domain and coiled-coil domain-containing protein At3g58270-like [Gastrolobium bilobum]|uniref:MATH domain and coiled-coil domain-containing protein At3g58270-like n=1 Tax=Gastrolobium bilobum TaxID=150636 RepID=UPI002AB172FA|nr:MATH domain and coiled-coil domain-containing protein At3g58270-like [Gastrolobium bilobum]